MKTIIADIIPKIKRHSKKLDDLTLLTNQHWVVLEELSQSKTVYIFRDNNELLISRNGKVEKAKWEHLGNNSLLIDKPNESYLFKHGFFDKNILALKIDSKDEYVFLINENSYNGELNSIERLIDFLTKKYLDPPVRNEIENSTGLKIEKPIISNKPEIILISHASDKGILEIEQKNSFFQDIKPRNKAFMDGKPASDGKYKLSFMWYIHIKDGLVSKITSF